MRQPIKEEFFFSFWIKLIVRFVNNIDVYSYEDRNNNPEFEKVQSISTLNEYHAGGSAASALNFSVDDNYLVSSNAGDNSVILYKIDHESGRLTKILCLPVSGDYPKDATLFPDNKHLVSLNHESDAMTFFNVDLEKGLIVMNGKELKVERPNCIIFQPTFAKVRKLIRSPRVKPLWNSLPVYPS